MRVSAGERTSQNIRCPKGKGVLLSFNHLFFGILDYFLKIRGIPENQVQYTKKNKYTEEIVYPIGFRASCLVFLKF